MKFKKILVPVDFSSVTDRSVEQAFDLARSQGASVLLITVVDDSFPYPEIFAIDLPGEDYHRSLRDRAKQGMKDLVARFGEGVPAETVVAKGRPAQVIVDMARAEGIDLIVMSTHGSTGIQHVLLGSITERVLHHAVCPVLVLRPPRE
jgi:nucleotide-binding universal stress UspA family protein